MLQLLTLLLALLGCLTTTSAHIVGFSSPRTIKPTDVVFFESIVANDINKYLDVAVALGLETADDCWLNTIIPAFYMFAVPEGIEHGDYVVTAQFMSLTGPSNLPIVEHFYANVTVGDRTDYKNFVNITTPTKNCFYGKSV